MTLGWRTCNKLSSSALAAPGRAGHVPSLKPWRAPASQCRLYWTKWTKSLTWERAACFVNWEKIEITWGTLTLTYLCLGMGTSLRYLPTLSILWKIIFVFFRLSFFSREWLRQCQSLPGSPSRVQWQQPRQGHPGKIAATTFPWHSAGCQQPQTGLARHHLTERKGSHAPFGESNLGRRNPVRFQLQQAPGPDPPPSILLKGWAKEEIPALTLVCMETSSHNPQDIFLSVFRKNAWCFRPCYTLESWWWL